MKNGRILISGVGIAGPTLAYWLHRYGFEPTLIERAPAFRHGGYIIDFWGLGFDIAENMGILPALRQNGYDIDEVQLVNERGKRVGGLNRLAIESILGDRYLSILRSDLSRIIYEALGGSVRTIYGDSVAAIDQDPDGVRITFAHAAPETFDLVIGAGGLHSPVRALVFGPEGLYESYLGYDVASFSVEGYRCRDPRAYVSFAAPGRQVSRYSLRGDRTVFFFVFSGSSGRASASHDVEAQKDVLRATFGQDGWECPDILKSMDRCNDLYFDSVSQIHMDSWSRGRVALIGDACSCPSLLAGQGAALAMIAAYILAAELKRAAGDYGTAFGNYRNSFHPFVTAKQRAAKKFAGSFAPKTRFGIHLRNQVTRLMTVPFVADWAMGGLLRDRLTLPAYD